MAKMTGQLDPSNRTHYLPEYSFKLDMEDGFDYYAKRDWMRSNPWIPIGTGLVYVATVFGLKLFMSKRPAYDLKLVLAIWSTLLATFSIVGTLRAIPELIHVLSNFGLKKSICVESDVRGTYGFWVFAFIMSKFPELLDTLFIVLRKQKLIFLHWFHHLSVLVLVWFSNSYDFSVGRWFLSMNYVVHSIMYSYYALRAAGIRPPKAFAMSITIAQMVQMFVGSYVTMYVLIEQSKGGSCRTNLMTVYISLFLYLSYLCLFGNFFVRSYFTGYTGTPVTSKMIDFYSKWFRSKSSGSNVNNNQIRSAASLVSTGKKGS